METDTAFSFHHFSSRHNVINAHTYWDQCTHVLGSGWAMKKNCTFVTDVMHLIACVRGTGRPAPRTHSRAA